MNVSSMEPRAGFVIATVLVVMGGLAANRISVDLAMVGGLTILLIGNSIWGGIVDLESALRGFSNPALFLIGTLFVVAAGLERTGGIEKIAKAVLGAPKSEQAALARLIIPVALMSSMMNNTPIVAMYLGIVRDWSKRLGISASKFYIPLSFAAILGGQLTLIGTASNVVVMGLYLDHLERLPLEQASMMRLTQLQEFWGVTLLGAPAAVVGLLLLIFGGRLIPARRPVDLAGKQAKHYHVEMCVADGAPIAGRSVEAAGLRHLPGLFLAHIERRGETIVAGRNLRLQVGDRLAFVGALDSVRDLRKIPGLEPLEDRGDSLPPAVPRVDDTALVEAVVSGQSRLVGRSIRESDFRAQYNAAIWAVHRHGEHLKGKIGEIVVRPGDTLLLEARIGVAEALRDSDDFYLTSLVRESRSVRHDKANLAILILVLMVLVITLSSLPPLVVALGAAALMIATGCVSGAVARKSISWQVLVVIGAALGIGEAMRTSGAAGYLTGLMLQGLDGAPPGVMIFCLFMMTSILAQLITNNGAAVLMFPIYMKVAESAGLSPQGVLFTLMVAAGSSFLSPIAYQTNLMVYGPGSYKFLDFGRVGLPLTILLALVCACVAPVAYGNGHFF